MKIALIQCPVWGTYDPPMALAQLSGCLKKTGYDVSVFDLNIKLYLNRKENYKNIWAWEQCSFWYRQEDVDNFFLHNKPLIGKYINQIINTKARVVGFSVSAASRLSSLKVATMIKAIDKEIIVIFGGPLFFEKRFIEEILKDDAVDIVVDGEGELTLVELVSLLETKRDIANCSGIYFRRDARIVNTGPRKSMDNLDLLPFLDFTDLPLSDYDDAKHIVFMASRGCTQRCVFCSSRSFWPGYRAMSGKRIFEEIKFHKKQQGKPNPDLGHVDFIDLMFNGNMKYLVEFCELMIEARLNIFWTANMIIRPEMNPEVIKKMSDSGCEHVIFGIESGSQRILDMMRKNYRIEDADRIIRWLHEAGIMVTCNFMFGFPTETQGDFQKTLDFIKRNAAFLHRAYPSRTYCAIEEFSYLVEHLEEFGIKPNPPNHLFWESIDGTNIYPERLRRCREFSNLASSLGVEIGCGVQTSVDLDELFNLIQYYEYKKDYPKALGCLLQYYKADSSNELIANKVQYYYTKIEGNDPDFLFDEDLSIKLKEAVCSIGSQERAGSRSDNPLRIGRGKSISLLKILRKRNSDLAEKEFACRQLALDSTPRVFSLQISGPCNSRCIFCPRKRRYELFDLNTYRTRFGDKIQFELSKAEQIIFSGFGEFLFLPEAEKILDYFDTEFPHVEKVFSTNGSSLSSRISERIVNSKNKYTINISLHASNPQLHALLTRTTNFSKILENLTQLIKLKEKSVDITVNLIFLATSMNIEDLPNFIRLAADLKIDKVLCYYNYIYNANQKYLSCFFKQEVTDRILNEAEIMAKSLSLKIDLPPKFNDAWRSNQNICIKPWRELMLDSRGRILNCITLEPCDYSFDGNNNIWTVWNSPYYQNLRRHMTEGNSSCLKHCLLANPVSVSDFQSHAFIPKNGIFNLLQGALINDRV